MLALDIRLHRGTFARHVQMNFDARVIGLCGPSGSGKTSVLHAIAGLVKPQQGRIEIEGRCLFDSKLGVNLPAHRRRIGYVFQDTRLFPHMDVRGNLLYGAHAVPPDAPRFGFDAVVELLGIQPLLGRRTANLSGGETQRVAIGRALLSQPSLLLLDEPLSMLDQARRDELIPYLQRVQSDIGLPIIHVSHNEDDIRRMSLAIHRLG